MNTPLKWCQFTASVWVAPKNKKNKIHFFIWRIQLFTMTHKCSSRAQRRLHSPAAMDQGTLQDMQMASQTPLGVTAMLTCTCQELIASDCEYENVFDLRRAGWSLSLIQCLFMATNNSWKHFIPCPGHDCLLLLRKEKNLSKWNTAPLGIKYIKWKYSSGHECVPDHITSLWEHDYFRVAFGSQRDGWISEFPFKKPIQTIKVKIKKKQYNEKQWI